MNISLQIDPRDLRKLDSLINEMQKTTGAEMPKVIRNTARDLVRAAIRNTPKAERGLERGVQIKTSSGKTVYLPARKLKPEYRGKNKRLTVRPGLARSGWAGCLVRLGVGRNPGKSGLKFSEMHERKNGNAAEMVVANTVPFIEDLDRGNYKNGAPAHILQRSVRDVAGKMEQRLQKMADRIVRKSIGI